MQIPLLYTKEIDTKEEIEWSEIIKELQYISELHKIGTDDNLPSLIKPSFVA